MLTLGFIGTGNMGGALAQAAAKSENNRLILANRHPEKAQRLRDKIGGELTDSRGAAAEADYIFLGVKPQMLETLFGQIRETLSARADRFVLVSMAAGTSIEKVQRLAGGDYPVIRIMPNTAVEVGEGVTMYCCSDNVTEAQREGFVSLLRRSGMLEELDESLIDAGSAVAGCGGAFACLFMEALADGAVYAGLPRQKAQRYAAQMLLGTAKLALEGGGHTAAMKDAICSPGGTTIAGVRTLEQRGFRAAAMDAVIAAYERTKALQ